MGQTRQILIVEDEPNIRLGLRTSLRSNDWTVATAEDGETALRWLERDAADLVLLDLRMPGMGGIEMLRRLRRAGHDVPVVVITAYDSVPNAVEAMREGATDFLAKPLTPAALRRVVTDVLARHELEKPARDDHGPAPRRRDMLSSAKRALNHRLFFRADALLHAAIKERPESAEPWYLLGVLRELQNKPRAACEAYRAALRVEPDYVLAKLHLAKVEGDH